MNKQTPDVLIFVTPKTLSDSSRVYNVHIGNVDLSAVTEDDASTLAEELVELIAKHTNNTADVVYE